MSPLRQAKDSRIRDIDVCLCVFLLLFWDSRLRHSPGFCSDRAFSHGSASCWIKGPSTYYIIHHTHSEFFPIAATAHITLGLFTPLACTSSTSSIFRPPALLRMRTLFFCAGVVLLCDAEDFEQ
ncbi:unnamed protein product [Periconia digitata]|uniref:Uncharacterized protein n=1 Tax=Periconia digitata TaxID=1303443 RepID=A0A9W4UDL2_9PLEO|nr:unnamed protein product [Periconia digitata]